MIGKSIRSDDNFGSVLHGRHTTVNSSSYGNPIEAGPCAAAAGRGFSRALSVARLRSHPINGASRRAPRRQSWLAPMASRSPPLAGWLRPALSRQARSAREEAEVNETWQVVSGIAADW
jgi:hypothetical protein